MQLGGFTHAKCHTCGHLGLISNFDQVKANETRTEGEDGFLSKCIS